MKAEGDSEVSTLPYRPNTSTKAQGVDEIELNVWELNEKAIRFYEGLGYETKRRM